MIKSIGKADFYGILFDDSEAAFQNFLSSRDFEKQTI